MTSSLVALPRGPRYLNVASQLRAEILDGVFAPGSALPAERDLCERLGVSRTPLREAIKVLSAQGLVELRAGRHPRVTRLSETDIRESFELLEALESLGGRLAAHRADASERALFAQLQNELDEAYAKRDRAAYFSLNEEFHRTIVRAARNQTLSSAYESLSARIRRTRYTAELSEERWLESIEEHRAIARALAQQDGEAAGDVLRRHLAHKGEIVLEAYGTREPEKLSSGNAQRKHRQSP